MLFKNALAQAFMALGVLTQVSAMDSTSPRLCRNTPEGQVQKAPNTSKNWVSDTIPVVLPNSPLQKPIRVQVNIIAPDNCTTEKEKLAHFASRAIELKTSVATVLKAYIEEAKKQTVTKKQSNMELLKIVPSGMYFEPDNRKLILQESFGTHQINSKIQAYLETRVLCTYDQTGNLTTNPYQLYVFQKTGGSKKPLVISMERLRLIYPDEMQLKINPTTQSAVMKASMQSAMNRTMAQLVNGQLKELIDPEADYRKAYTEDLVTMLAYYFTTQDILDID